MSTVIKNVIFKDISQFIHKENGFLASELLSCLAESKSWKFPFKSLFYHTHMFSWALVKFASCLGSMG